MDKKLNVIEDIRRTAGQMLRINAVIYVFLTMNVSIFFMLRIGGETRSSLVIDSGFIWFFVIPLAVVLSQFARPPMVLFYLVLQSTEVLKFLLGLWYFRRGRWIRNLT